MSRIKPERNRLRRAVKGTTTSSTLAGMILFLGLPPCALAQNTEPKTVEVGFEQRVRNENWNNIFDWSDQTDDQRNQIRYRTRLWTKVAVTPKVQFALGLDQETNQVIVPRKAWQFDEIMFETAYLDFRDLLAKGLSLRVGRQNFSKDDGFLFVEGGPWDGSRSVYSNAVNLGYSFNKSKVELIGISNPARDQYLPRIHDQHRLLVEWDEQAIGSYFTHTPSAQTDLEAYYFLKKEVHDTRQTTDPQFQPDRHVNTAGGRAAHRWGHGWSAAGEAAAQWGKDHAGVDIRGRGGYSYVKRSFDRTMKPYLLGGYWGFSGDNPATTGRNESWDPLFSRWPKWSEMYIYSQFKEKGVGYWTNTGMWQAEAGFSPWKPINWRFTYYHMSAFHPFAGNPKIFGAGTERGDQFQTRLDFAFNPSWRGHVLYEWHVPGDFYEGPNRGYFLRFEMIYTTKVAFNL